MPVTTADLIMAIERLRTQRSRNPRRDHADPADCGTGGRCEGAEVPVGMKTAAAGAATPAAAPAAPPPTPPINPAAQPTYPANTAANAANPAADPLSSGSRCAAEPKRPKSRRYATSVSNSIYPAADSANAAAEHANTPYHTA